MVAKAVLALCASALLVQSTFAACIGSVPTMNWSGCGSNLGLNAFATNAGCYSGNIVPACSAASSGGAFGVTTSSAIAPSGLSVVSDNEIGGILDAAGELPVLAAVALESTLPTSGSAGTTYSCGNGQVGISSDTLSAAGLNAGYGAGFGTGLGAGYGAGFGTGLGAGYGANLAAANFANAGAFGGWNGARFGGCGCRNVC